MISPVLDRETTDSRRTKTTTAASGTTTRINSSYEKEHKQRGSDLVTNEVDQQRNPYHERSLVPVMQRKQQVYTRCRRLQLMVLIHFEPPQKQKVTCRNEKGGGLG